MNTLTIVIIGGGAAGVSVLAQLVDKYVQEKLPTANQKIQILVVEKSGTMGAGLAYGTDDESHILNLSAENMSFMPDATKHFINWVKSNADKWKPHFPNLNVDNNSYTPRKLFHLYLADLAATTKQYAEKNNITVKFIQDEVIDIQAETADKYNKFEISLASSDGATKIHAEQVILCIGHLPPVAYSEFIGKPNYYHSPWPTQQFISNIPKTEHVYILGTRLTAIDIVLSLINGGHSGPITMISQNGWLPCVIGPTKPYTREFLNLDTVTEITANGTQKLPLQKLLELFKKEIEHAENEIEHTENASFVFDINKLLKSAKPSQSAKNWLAKEIRRAETTIRPWQSVLSSLYPIVPNIWNALTLTDKKEFLKTYYSLWMTYLAAFPIENAKKIQALMETGQLEVSGGMESVKFLEQEQNYEISLSNSKVIHAKYLINCTGAGHDITKANDSILLKNLLERKLIIPHPLGGIKIDFTSLNVKSNTPEKQIVKGLFVIGKMTGGTCLATDDLGQIGREAKRAVNSSYHQLHEQILLTPSLQGKRTIHENGPVLHEVIQGQINQFLKNMQDTLSKQYGLPSSVPMVPLSSDIDDLVTPPIPKKPLSLH